MNCYAQESGEDFDLDAEDDEGNESPEGSIEEGPGLPSEDPEAPLPVDLPEGLVEEDQGLPGESPLPVALPAALPTPTDDQGLSEEGHKPVDLHEGLLEEDQGLPGEDEQEESLPKAAHEPQGSESKDHAPQEAKAERKIHTPQEAETKHALAAQAPPAPRSEATAAAAAAAAAPRSEATAAAAAKPEIVLSSDEAKPVVTNRRLSDLKARLEQLKLELT